MKKNEGATLCFTDRSIKTGLANPGKVSYETRVYKGNFDIPKSVSKEKFEINIDKTRVYVPLLKEEGNFLSEKEDVNLIDSKKKDYLIIDILYNTCQKLRNPLPIRIHMYELGKKPLRIVGIERFEDNSSPFNL